MLAVDHVVAEEKRNMEPGFLHGDVLIAIGQLCADDIEQRADLALRDHASGNPMPRRPARSLSPAEYCVNCPIFSSQRHLARAGSSTRSVEGLSANWAFGMETGARTDSSSAARYAGR